jgi:hypothetical protein
MIETGFPLLVTNLSLLIEDEERLFVHRHSTRLVPGCVVDLDVLISSCGNRCTVVGEPGC